MPVVLACVGRAVTGSARPGPTVSVGASCPGIPSTRPLTNVGSALKEAANTSW